MIKILFKNSFQIYTLAIKINKYYLPIYIYMNTERRRISKKIFHNDESRQREAILSLKTRPQPDLRIGARTSIIDGGHHDPIIPARQIIFTVDIVETLPKQLRRGRQLTNRWSAAKHEFFPCNKLAHNDGSAPRDVLREGAEGGGEVHGLTPVRIPVNRLLTDRWIAQNICRACQTFVEPTKAHGKSGRRVYTGSSSGDELVGDSFGLVSFSLFLSGFSDSALSFFLFFLSRYSKWYIERFSV